MTASICAKPKFMNVVRYGHLSVTLEYIMTSSCRLADCTTYD
jgi:hypothetical protein